MNGFSEAVIICKGNVGDPGFFLYLAKVKENLQNILKTEKETFTVKKVEKWNSVKVTFNLPQNAASRLRELARRSPSALEALGIHSVQVDNDQVISVILSDQSSITFSGILPNGQSSLNSTTPPDSGIESSASTSGGSADNNNGIPLHGDPQDKPQVPPETIEAVKRCVIDYLQNQKQHQQQETAGGALGAPASCSNEFRAPIADSGGRILSGRLSSGTPPSSVKNARNTPSPVWRQQQTVGPHSGMSVEQRSQQKAYFEQRQMEQVQHSHAQNEHGMFMGQQQQDNPVAGMENMVNSRNIVSNSPLLVNLLRSASPTGNSGETGPLDSNNAISTMQQQFFPPSTGPGLMNQHQINLGFTSQTMLSTSAGQACSTQETSLISHQSEAAAMGVESVTPPKKKRRQYKKKNMNNSEQSVQSSTSMQSNAHTVARPPQMPPYSYSPGGSQEWYQRPGPGHPDAAFYPHHSGPPYVTAGGFHGQYREHHPGQQSFDVQQQQQVRPPWYPSPHHQAPSSSHQQLGLQEQQLHHSLHDQQQPPGVSGPNSSCMQGGELSNKGMIESPGLGSTHRIGNVPGSSLKTEFPVFSRHQQAQGSSGHHLTVPACPEHISQSIDAVLNQVTQESPLLASSCGSSIGNKPSSKKRVCDKVPLPSTGNGPVNSESVESKEALVELEKKRLLSLNSLHLNNGPDCDTEFKIDSPSVRDLGSATERRDNSGSYGWQGMTQFNGPGPPQNSDGRMGGSNNNSSAPPVIGSFSNSSRVENDLINAKTASNSNGMDTEEVLGSVSILEKYGLGNSVGGHSALNGTAAAEVLGVNGVVNGLSNGVPERRDSRSRMSEELEAIVGSPQAAIAVRAVHGAPRSPSAIFELKERQRTLVTSRSELGVTESVRQTATNCSPTINGRLSPQRSTGLTEKKELNLENYKLQSTIAVTETLNGVNHATEVSPTSASPEIARDPAAGLTIDILAAVARSGASEYFVRPSPSSISASSSTVSEPSPVPSEGSRTRNGGNRGQANSGDRRHSVTSPTPSIGSLEDCDAPSSTIPAAPRARGRPRRKPAEISTETVRSNFGVSYSSGTSNRKRNRSRESSGGSSTASGRSSATAKRRGSSSNCSSRGASRERLGSVEGPGEVFELPNSSRRGGGFEVPMDRTENTGKTRSSTKHRLISGGEGQSGLNNSSTRNFSEPAANHAIAKSQSGRKSTRKKGADA